MEQNQINKEKTFAAEFTFGWSKLQKIFAEEAERPVVEDHRTYEVRHDSHACWVVPKHRKESEK